MKKIWLGILGLFILVENAWAIQYCGKGTTIGERYHIFVCVMEDHGICDKEKKSDAKKKLKNHLGNDIRAINASGGPEFNNAADVCGLKKKKFKINHWYKCSADKIGYSGYENHSFEKRGKCN